MKLKVFYLLLSFLLSSCAASNSSNKNNNSPEQNLFSEKSFELAEVEFRKQGVSPASRPYMKEVCRGFELTEEQVRDFFNDSEVISEKELQGDLRLLPCHSVGTISINDEQYSWVIRAGGIGEFFNKNDKFYKVCGRECCKKNPGLC